MFASILSGFGGAGLGQILKVGGGVLTVLLIVPALLRLVIVTVDEGWAAIRTRNGRPIIRKREHAVHYTRQPTRGSSSTRGDPHAGSGRRRGAARSLTPDGASSADA